MLTHCNNEARRLGALVPDATPYVPLGFAYDIYLQTKDERSAKKPNLSIVKKHERSKKKGGTQNAEVVAHRPRTGVRATQNL